MGKCFQRALFSDQWSSIRITFESGNFQRGPISSLGRKVEFVDT